mmetsp:Transcript_35662/g.70551  ORF Transcript_35662/g.70551 Transcript_35662/m.70551 type:complete len:840 (+) Transcript_35662:52-2571(+)
MQDVRICDEGGSGMVLPLFKEHSWDSGFRGFLYLAGLLYCFLGVNIVADKFVNSIEAITSKKRRVWHQSAGRHRTTAVWNSTVANLSLLSLGSSAPEILLSIVEIVGGGFHNGKLGPGVIVGSAAFNLFVIVAFCILAIPSPDTRMIEKYDVFIVTAVFSMLAYLWLVFIVQVSSPDLVEIWEAVVTLQFFFVLIGVSYAVDKGCLHRLTAHRDAALKTISGNSFRPQISGGPGIIGFASDACDVTVGLERREIKIPVLRTKGMEGMVSCRFYTQSNTALPGHDYVDQEGELQFPDGSSEAEISLEVLPKRMGENTDQFRIILADICGGAVFDPLSDGAPKQCIFTVTIKNANASQIFNNPRLRMKQHVDSALNLDSLRQGRSDWYTEIVESVCFSPDGGDAEKPSTTDKIMHYVGMPWKLFSAFLVPPTSIFGGWLCFWLSIMVIGAITAVIIDMANIFGCVTGVNDVITAITLVALGTSMPDLFASYSAAKADEWADASIVNVTGSNSVNVFLGIGLPWTMAAVYWWFQGPTDEWKAYYPELSKRYPEGGFIVRGGDLAFGVASFMVAAMLAFALFRVRRTRCGGELGGQRGTKFLSIFMLILLWLYYVFLQGWKVLAGDVDISQQALAMGIATLLLEHLVLAAGLVVYGCISRGGRRSTRTVGTTSEEDLSIFEPKPPAPIPEMPDPPAADHPPVEHVSQSEAAEIADLRCAGLVNSHVCKEQFVVTPCRTEVPPLHFNGVAGNGNSSHRRPEITMSQTPPCKLPQPIEAFAPLARIPSDDNKSHSGCSRPTAEQSIGGTLSDWVDPHKADCKFLNCRKTHVQEPVRDPYYEKTYE